MKWLLVAVIALGAMPGCTWTHRIVLSYDTAQGEADDAWKAQITRRVNALTTCQPQEVQKCVDWEEAGGNPAPKEGGL